MRVLALDIGDVRVGIALTDPMQTIASPFETYRRVGFLKDIAYITELAKTQEVSEIVCGLPLSMDGKDNNQSLKVREFVKELKNQFEGKVVFMDERFTTVTAQKSLIESGVRRDDRKNVVDKVAASIILQTYLAKKQHSK